MAERKSSVDKDLNLEEVTSILEDGSAAMRAMWLHGEAFGNIYQYMVRYIERYHYSAYRVLLTLKLPESLPDEKREAVRKRFHDLAEASLRTSDVMVECGDHQLFLLLPEVREHDIGRVIGRLLDCWNSKEPANAFPVRAEYAPVRTPGRGRKAKHRNLNSRIAVVDDDRFNLMSAKSILEKRGYETVFFRSGQELLTDLEENRDWPGLILLDVRMPGMDGFETMRRLRHTIDREERIPVIFLTGVDDPEVETKCLEQGAMDFIHKPFAPEVLVTRVKHTLELTLLQRDLTEEVARKTRENESLLLNVVQALAESIDAKDRYTNGHSSRVAEYAREIARRYGYTKEQQDEIYMMGLLHDVGKIGIPDTIINKPGRLTDEEYGQVKEHPLTGAKILGRIKEMPLLSEGARWHHERYDGSGYPDGLAGSAIPEQARIIAVADAYDAMTSHRSYRDILPQETVRQEIEKGKGTQFDPAFADIMLQIMSEDGEFRLRER